MASYLAKTASNLHILELERGNKGYSKVVFFPGLPRKSISSFFIEDTENIGALVTFITCSSLKYPTMSHMLIIKVFIFLFFFFETLFSILNLLHQQKKIWLWFKSPIVHPTEVYGSAGMKKNIAKLFTCFLSKCNHNSFSKTEHKKNNIRKNTQKIHTESSLSSNLFGSCISTSFIALCIPEEPPTAF